MAQGMEKLEDVPGTLDSLILGVAAPAVTPSPVSGPRFIRADTGAIKVLVKNIVEALRYPEWCGVTVRYDTFRNEVLWGDRPVHDIDTTRLNITLTELGIGPGAIRTEMLESAMALVAHEREFDSAIEWLTPLVWDHTPRCATFCPRYLGTEDTPYHRAVSLYWWTAHAGRVLRPAGVQADSAIILVSTQGTGKTSVTKAMVPLPEHYVEIQLHGDDKDRIRKMRGKLIGELAELSGLKSRDAESIKALISATGDSLVDKYEKHAQDLSRRLVFVGSSNNDDFLSDPTGNRRFYPVYVGDHQDLQAIRRDRDQLWAEAAHLFLAKGEVMWEDAARLVLAEHHKFEDVDSWEEDIIPWLNCPENWLLTDQATQYVRTGKILTEALSIEKGRRSKRDEYRIGRIMARYGCCTKIRVVNSKATKVWVKQDSKENI
jgi:predicted P-loop ATPase